MTATIPISPKVYLVGAGPGDPKLLTLRAVECLKMADVILYDGLANPQILIHARPDCRQICVSKHGREKSWTQQEITQQVVSEALAGNCVVRLKGGDPAVFARSAEELEKLAAENIPFEVVPGITAALAASSYAGIPITHRDWASSVAFITAHGQAMDGGEEGDEPHHWQAISAFPGTLVFYMGVASAARWSRKLIDAGKSPTTPVALIQHCSLPIQKTAFCTLQDIAQKIEQLQWSPPVITIVGDVVNLGTTLDWFSKRPLFHRTVLLTRPRELSDEWRDVLESLGARVWTHPVVAIEPLSIDWERLAKDSDARPDWLVFTSRNGVRHFVESLKASGRDARWFKDARIATVGPATAATLRDYHWIPDLTLASDCNADHLGRVLGSQVQNRLVWFVRGDKGGDALRDQLRSGGANVCELLAYRNRDIESADPDVLQSMQQGEIDYTTVTSQSIAKSLAHLFGEHLHRTRLVSISKNVSQTLESLGYSVYAELAPEEFALPSSWIKLANGDHAPIRP